MPLKTTPEQRARWREQCKYESRTQDLLDDVETLAEAARELDLLENGYCPSCRWPRDRGDRHGIIAFRHRRCMQRLTPEEPGEG